MLDVSSFETVRLRAERLRSDHFDVLDRMHRNPRMMTTLGGLRGPAETRRLLTDQLAHWDRYGFGLWVCTARNDGAFAGRGGLRHVHVGGNDEVELAYAVAADRWGQGLATEMAEAMLTIGFRDLGLPEVVCFTMTSNRASRRVMEKLGFTYERDIVYANLPHVLYRKHAGH
jgi:RimJ/RimL family protein N-acetyltransferase